jgi:Na+/H+-dicarboxylate symporter
MSLTTRVLAGLVAGLLCGLALLTAPVPFSLRVVNVMSPIGTLFVNLIRMTVIPLVVSMLVASVGSMAASGVLARIAARAAVVAVAMLAIAATASLVIARPVLARVRIDQAAAMGLRSPAAAAAEAQQPPPGSDGFVRWLVDLVPPNVVKAASDGAMLPLIVFSVLFGLSLAKVEAGRREVAVRLAAAIADAMQRLVAGILELAPFGVFALAVPLAARLGLAVAGAVLAYVVLVVVLTVVVGALLLYPVGMIGGRMSLSAFTAFCAPAQAVAFASRSSLAALPAMVESAERAGRPAAITGFLLPLAASVFRMGGAVAQTVGVLFLARLYGVTLSPVQLVSVVFTVVLTTFAVPGIPGGSIIAMVPVLTAVNLPLDGIGILLAVDTVPDMFRTTENVTGSMTLAALVRLEPR